MRSNETARFSLDRRQCLLGLGALTGMALTQSFAASRSTIDLQVATALDLSAGLKAGTWSARELGQYYLGRIETLNGPFERFDDNGALNAFIRTFPDLARAGWERADQARSYSDWSGVPVAMKDVFSVAGKPLTVGTPAHRSYRAPKDCAVWRKWSDAGAVLLGHTQAQRFVSGVETPQTANPWNPRLIVGGSSGGSGAAVAAGLVPIALGAEIVWAEIPEELGISGLFSREDARFGGHSARTILTMADDLTTAMPGQQEWLAHATPEEWDIAIEWYEAKDRSLKSDEFLSKAALVNPQTLALARAEREKLRAGWEALLAQHRCDAHIYLEVGSSLPERKGLDDTPSPRLQRDGVRPNDLGWPVLGMPVSRVNGLDVPISAQIMARRWHDPQLLAWGMAWQQQHPEFVRLLPNGLTAAV